MAGPGQEEGRVQPTQRETRYHGKDKLRGSREPRRSSVQFKNLLQTSSLCGQQGSRRSHLPAVGEAMVQVWFPTSGTFAWGLWAGVVPPPPPGIKAHKNTKMSSAVCGLCPGLAGVSARLGRWGALGSRLRQLGRTCCRHTQTAGTYSCMCGG